MIFASFVVGFMALIVTAYILTTRKHSDAGATSEVSSMLVFIIGILCGMRHFIIAAKCGYKRSLNMVKRGFTQGHVTKEDFEKTLRDYQASCDETKSEQRDRAAVIKAARESE